MKRRVILTKTSIVSVVGGLGLFALLMFGVVAYFGSFGAASAWLNGRPFYLSPRLVRLENREAGAKEVVTFQLKNLTSKDISVVGEKSSCSCAFSENIPIKVNPGKTGEVKIRVSLPKYKTDYDQSILLMIATAKKLELAEVRVVANVPNPLPEPEEEEAAELEKEKNSEPEALEQEPSELISE